MAFFVCFFAWFACALMPVIKGEFGLPAQVANINIAAVAITILVRSSSDRCATAMARARPTGLLLLRHPRAGRGGLAKL
jgi:NNP family nitrate/nitrite transporter-like MFS transporter